MERKGVKSEKAVNLRLPLFDFTMERCPDGYQIEGGRLRPRSRATMCYRLEADAYLRLANLPLTRQGPTGTWIDRGPAGYEPQAGARWVIKPDNRAILAFAQGHGLLRSDTAGEPLAAWRRAVAEMWSLLETIQQHLIEFEEHIGEKDAARRELNKVHATINRHLRGITFQSTGDPPRFRKQIVARDLLAALWAQAYEALTSDYTFRGCDGCGRWIEVTPAGQRTCSDACRMAVYNRIKRAAVEMRAEGRTQKQIVERLQSAYGWKNATPMRQLKIWLKEK